MATTKFKICPVCGTHNSPGSLECKKCETDLTGVPIVSEEAQTAEATQEADAQRAEATEAQLVRICSECGAVNPPQARKCQNCGEDISDVMPTRVEAAENTEASKAQTDSAATSQAQTDSAATPQAQPEPADPEFPPYELVSVDGECRFVSNQTEVVIGREGEMKEYLKDRLYVGRKQAMITLTAIGAFIQNMSHTNQTYLNNEPLPGHQLVLLHDGDEIGLGGKVIDGARQDLAAYLIYHRTAQLPQESEVSQNPETPQETDIPHEPETPQEAQ